MRLKSIKLCNFRQFYGQTPEIQLSGGEQNTTIIHGNNGAGKTTLLNGFTWVLYEQFTAAFANSEQLVNKRAIQEAIPGKSVEYAVELTFEHDYKSYQLKRRCYATKKQDKETIENSESQLFMLIAGDDGCWQHPLEYPDDIIGRILPASLHQYFFFDGERIDHIIRYQKKTGLTEATKELLGIKIFERATEHLKNARRSIEEELRKIGDLQTQILLKRKKKLEEETDSIQERQDDINSAIAQKQEEKDELGEQLLTLKGAENLQTIKNNLEKDYKETREQLVRLNEKIKETISNQGYTVFMTSLAEKCSGLFQELQATKELPSGIKKPFVENLLDRECCICGTKLIPGTLPHDQVKQWMEKAGNVDVEEALIRLHTQTQAIEKQAFQFWKIVDETQEEIRLLRRKLASLEEELETVKQQLREYPDQEIKRLQEELDTTEKALENLLLEKGRNEIELKQKTEQLESLNQQLTQEQRKEEKQQLAQRRRKATEEAMTCIKQLKGEYQIKEEGLHPYFIKLWNMQVKDYPKIKFTHVPREQNTEADALANEAMDGAKSKLL